MDDKKPIGTGDKAIIGNFNLQAQLPNSRSISIAGYIYDGEVLQSVNERLDMLQDAIERQKLRCEIPELEVAREQRVTALRQMKEHMEGIEAKERDGRKLTSQERMTLQNMSVNMKKVNEDIEKGDIAIADAKRKAGVA
jgi:hypothetical protein